MMELFSVDQIALDEVTKALLDGVDQTARKVNELRPLSSEIVAKVHRELLGERVYSSNAIEGNTFNLGETIETLRTGHIDITRRREATEVVNLGKAIENLQEDLSASASPHNVQSFLGLHRLLLAGINDDWAGRFRGEQVLIRGAKYQPPEHRFVPGMVEQFFERLRNAKNTNAIQLAAWAHWSIARIHPFMDGNGRMARLWQDLILYQRRLTCAIIPPEAKPEYLRSLVAADEGDFNPLTQLVAQRVASTLDKYLIAQKEAEATSEWAQNLIGETSARAAEKRRLAYLRWSRKMEELCYEFEVCASTVTHGSTDIEIQVYPYEIIDQGTWENIRTGLPASKTWFFKINFRREQSYLNYIFFFGKHYWTDLDGERERSEPRVCLLISEQEGKEVARRLGAFPTPLSIRQIFVVGKDFVRVRSSPNPDEVQPDGESLAYDKPVSASTIAQEFIRDVLLVRMT